jgi:hypothetical protein
MQHDDTVGVLVISVRRDDGAHGLIAQLTAIEDLAAEPCTLSVAGDAEAVIARVQEWLRAVTSGTALGW